MTEISVGEALIALIHTAYRADMPVLVEGSHGVGKSEAMVQAAKQLEIECTTIDLSLCEPVDLVGLPALKAGRTDFLPPAILPTSGKGLLVLEEINRAPRHVRAPCLQLLTSRRLNSYELPTGWLPIACANPSDDPEQYDVDELDPALRSRFICVRVTPNLHDWLAWAQANSLHETVIATVREGKQEALTKGGGNPRSWHYASRVLRAWECAPREDAILVAMLVGALGDRWGAVLARNYGSRGQRLDVDEILSGSATVAATMSVWRSRKRLDALKETWEMLRTELGSNATGKRVASSPQQLANLERFIGQLPPDIESEAHAWLSEHVLALRGSPLRSAARRRRASR